MSLTISWELGSDAHLAHHQTRRAHLCPGSASGLCCVAEKPGRLLALRIGEQVVDQDKGTGVQWTLVVVGVKLEDLTQQLCGRRTCACWEGRWTQL